MNASVPPSVIALEAALLHPEDDVATALVDLRAGHSLALACDAMTCEVVTVEPIPAGHKVSTHALGAGRRIRKYGEFIGRMTADTRRGAWVHSHNLVTSAVRTVDDEHAWRAQEAPPGGVHPVGAARSAFGASPIYDRERGTLLWIDTAAASLVVVDVERGDERVWPIAAAPRAMVLALDGDALVATDAGLARIDPRSGTTMVAAGWEAPSPLRVTGLQCDARGRVWATAANPGSAAADGKLFMFDAGRGRATVASRLLTPSGLAWSVDGTTLYLAESGRAVVHVYDFDLDNGGLGQPHTFADLGAMPGDLGGLTVDGDDHLWVALPGASCLVRCAPTGRIDRVVRMPVTLSTACAFGGDHGERMFVTTARDGSLDGERRAEALAGRTLVFDAGVAGRPPHRARMP